MRLFLGILLLLGAALYVPESRAVLVDAVRPVIDTVLGWSTKGEMRAMARNLGRDVDVGRDVPRRPREFERWLERNYNTEEARTDPWGNRYEFRVWRDSVGILSPGPDGETESADDLLVTVPVDRHR